MFLGPIIHGELLRISRQKRWYILRALLAFGLLLLIYSAYSFWNQRMILTSEEELSQAQLGQLATQCFMTIATGQTIVIVLLVPLLVAGSIAEEKQRKTLHYLLASRMSSFEIVWGKLVARMMMVFLPIVIALPILTMLSLFGGVDPNILIGLYAATFTTALFEASIGIFCSTMMKRGREALFTTLVLLGLVMFGPGIIAIAMLESYAPFPDIYNSWIEPVMGHFRTLSPLSLLGLPGPGARSAMSPAELTRAVEWMCGYQLVASVGVLAFSTWRLRPVFAKQDGAVKKPPRNRVGRVLTARLRKRKPIGENAILWKETHGSRTSRFGRIVVIVSAVTMLSLNYIPLADMLPGLWNEIRQVSIFSVLNYHYRGELNTLIRINATVLFTLWLFLLATAAATSISREREDDSWISLVSTPLEARELLTAKLVGSYWTPRFLVYAVVFFLLAGLATGALHPVGFALGCLHLVVFSAFIVGFGTIVSLRARTTMRAILIVISVFLSLLVLIPMIVATVSPSSLFNFATCPPFLFSLVLLSPLDWARLTGRVVYTGDYQRIEFEECLKVEYYATFSYALLALVCLYGTYRLFNRILDRPKRPLISLEPVSSRAAAQGVPAAAAPADLPAGRG